MFHSILLLVALFSGPAAQATSPPDEIKGQVEQIGEGKVTIRVVASSRIRFGDAFRVVVEVPGIGEARVAAGKIERVAETTVVGNVERASGNIAVGQDVLITVSGKPESTERPRNVPPMSKRPSRGQDSKSPARPGTRRSRFPTAELKSRLQGQTKLSRETVRGVARAVAALHLSGHPLDDEIGRRTLVNLLRALDADKLFFTRQDVDNFERRAHVYDDQLRAGSIEFAYEIFETYLARLRDRVALADEILDEEGDFTVDEFLVRDRDQRTFARNDDDARDISRKWIKYHLLTHRTLGIDLAEARLKTTQSIADLLRRMHEVDDAALLETTLQSLMTAYDPRCMWYSEDTFQEQNTQLAGEITGIGASLVESGGHITVDMVLPGGPAEKDGRLQPGDRIIAVAQESDQDFTDINGWPLRKAVAQIRGPVNSTVRLRVVPKGGFESYVYALTRARIELAQPESTILTGNDVPAAPDSKLGFISLPSFYRDLQAERAGNREFHSTARDLRPILEGFKKADVDVIVLDLRDNQGGPLEETIDTTSLFIGSLPSVLSRDRSGNVESYANENADLAWAGPLVVLTNRQTTGGAEILAAAVQDHARGLVIGDPSTFGMGTVRHFYDVGQFVAGDNAPPRLGYVLVTTSKLYRPQGRSLQNAGVRPDLLLPSPTSALRIGERQQPFALGADDVPPVLSTGFGFGADDGLRARLDESSRARRAGSEWFRQIGQTRYPGDVTSSRIRLTESSFRDERERARTPATVTKLRGTKRVANDDYLGEVVMLAVEYKATLKP